MSRQIFVTSDTVRPSQRWMAAFPQGCAWSLDRTLAEGGSADVLWVSTDLPDWRGAVRQLVARLPSSPVAVQSLVPGDLEGLLALECGARAYCHALAVPEMLHELAEAIRHGGLWVGPELMARVVGAARRGLAPVEDPALASLLSARELEVARAAASGATNREIAATLGITERTVKAHMGAVFEKLGVRDRLQLVLRLSRQGETAGVG